MITNLKKPVKAFNPLYSKYDEGIIRKFNKTDDTYTIDFITNQIDILTEDVVFIKSNITFDLETLGNTSKAPITQIGAVKFTDEGKVLDTFSTNIDFRSLSKFNFEINYDTLEWWFTQEDAAIKALVNKDTLKVDITTALKDLDNWIGDTKNYVYWSHATFDPPILNNTIKECKSKLFIPYSSHRDIRTLTHLVGYQETKREGIAHNAIDDCLFQVKYICKGLNILKHQKNRKIYQLDRDSYAMLISSMYPIEVEEDFVEELNELFDMWLEDISEIEFEDYFNKNNTNKYQVERMYTESI